MQRGGLAPPVTIGTSDAVGERLSSDPAQERGMRSSLLTISTIRRWIRRLSVLSCARQATGLRLPMLEFGCRNLILIWEMSHSSSLLLRAFVSLQTRLPSRISKITLISLSDGIRFRQLVFGPHKSSASL